MDIASWLHSLGLDCYEQAFRDNQVDVDILPKPSASRSACIAASGGACSAFRAGSRRSSRSGRAVGRSAFSMIMRCRQPATCALSFSISRTIRTA